MTIAIPVSEIFTSVQGEGPLSGTCAVFLRVGRCNLACSFCDTDFSSSEKLSIPVIIELLKIEFEKNPTVHDLVLTGGEPSLFATDLIRMIRSQKFVDAIPDLKRICVETNGLRKVNWWRLKEYYTLVVVKSPKMDYVEHYPKQEAEDDDYFKLVIPSIEEAAPLIAIMSEKFRCIDPERVYLQPMNNSKKIARELVKKGLFGCKLSMQIHKFLGVR